MKCLWKVNQVFKNCYGEVRSGWSMIPLILLIVTGMSISQGLTAENYSIVNQILVSILYGVITIGGCFLLVKFFYNRSFKQIGIHKEKWMLELIYGILIGIAATVLLYVFLIITNQIRMIRYDLKYLFSVTMIVEILSLAVFVFVEELLTRGYFMTALKTTRKKPVIFFTSAILFALLHLANEGVTLLSTFNTFLAGILFAYMFVKSGKLWIPIGFHFAWNYMQSTILGLIVSGNEQTSVIITEFGNNSLLMGGNYGPEGGLLVTIILAICFLYVKIAVKRTSKDIWTMENDLPLKKNEKKN